MAGTADPGPAPARALGTSPPQPRVVPGLIAVSPQSHLHRHRCLRVSALRGRTPVVGLGVLTGPARPGLNLTALVKTHFPVRPPPGRRQDLHPPPGGAETSSSEPALRTAALATTGGNQGPQAAPPPALRAPGPGGFLRHLLCFRCLVFSFWGCCGVLREGSPHAHTPSPVPTVCPSGT